MAKKLKTGSASTNGLRRVEFETRLADLHIRSVVLTGDFTSWSAGGIPLEKGAAGSWKGRLELPPGEYQYRLLVDSQWHDDPLSTRRVPGPFGAENCVLLVP